MRAVWIVGALLGAGVIVFLSTGGSAAAVKGAKSRPRVPVVAAAATRGDIGVYLTGLGSVTPLNQVTIRSRVDGQLMHVFFKEGEVIAAGSPLAEIDPRPYAVQVTQAEGQLVKDTAQLNNARVDVKRYRDLWASDSIPQQTVASGEAMVAQLEGVVKSDQAQLDNARLNVEFCHISAPVSGRVGLRQLDPGNMVHATDANGLVTITQLRPIAATFTIAEDRLRALLQALGPGKPLAVEAFDREQKIRLAEGALLTTDNQIDPTTGTLKCKAVFPNDDGQLFPNEFVNIRLLLRTKHGVTLVPSAAIQRGSQQSTFVYLVRDGVVSVRPVTVDAGEGDWVEVATGLKPGDMVVLEGMDRLDQGSLVTVRAPAKASEPHT